jgi:hypothetical protein
MDGEKHDRTRQQDEKDSLREPRSTTMEEMRVTYAALARRWRSYTRQQERHK